MTTNRIIVNLQPFFDFVHNHKGVLVKLDKAPVAFPQGASAAPFSCPAPTWAIPGAVLQHGRDLRQSLAQHPAIDQMLQMLVLSPPTQITPIYFYLQAPEAEQLYWEALYDDGQGVFLSLDRRWPIGRMADALTTQPLQSVRLYTGQLRMVAVLSAIGVSAAPEWQALRQAIADARAGGLPVELLLLVGEEALHDTIQAEITAGALSGVGVRLIEDTVDKLETAIDSFAPHLLHFFCHGAVDHGVSRLEIATALDWAMGNTVSSLILPVDSLIALPSMREVWLAVLNCCQGGAATSQLHSMAHSIVARGAPAAVGMLEPIAAVDAFRFSAGFYPALFREIAQAVAAANGGVAAAIEWSLPLRSARIQLNTNVDPKSERAWTLPVLYVRPELFQVVRAGGQLEVAGQPAVATAKDPSSLQTMIQRVQEVAEFLRTLPPDTPATLRSRVLTILDDDPPVPPELRPDLFGQFGDRQIV